MNNTPHSGAIEKALDAKMKEIRKTDTHVTAMRRTWRNICEDMLNLGSLTRKQAAQQTADYVYMYGHEDPAEAKRLSGEIMRLNEKEFTELTLLAFDRPRYSA